MTTKSKSKIKGWEAGFGLRRVGAEWWLRNRGRGEDFWFRATSAGATLSASGKRTLLDRKPAVSRVPKATGAKPPELYLQPRSSPLWFAQPARPRQGTT